MQEAGEHPGSWDQAAVRVLQGAECPRGRDVVAQWEDLGARLDPGFRERWLTPLPHSCLSARPVHFLPLGSHQQPLRNALAPTSEFIKI